MTGLVLSTIWRHWRRHRTQFFMLLIGLAAATALLTGVLAINAQAKKSYARAEQTVTGSAQTIIKASGGGRIALARYGQLRRAGLAVAPVVEGRFAWPRLDGSPRRVTLIGIEPVAFSSDGRVATSKQNSIPQIAGEGSFADFVGDPGVAYASEATLASLRASADLPPLRAGDNLTDGTILMDIRHAARLLERGGEIDRLILLEPLPDILPATLLQGLVVQTPDDRIDLGELTDSFHLNLTAFGLLSFLVGLFIVYAALSLASHDRLPLFGTLLACGVPRALLLRVLLAEMAILAFVAGVLGVVLGYAIAGSLLPGVSATLGGLYGATVSDSLSLDPGWWLSGLAISALGVLLAGSATLWRIAQLPILAMRPGRAWLGGEKRLMKLQAVLGLILLLMAFLVLPRFDHLAAAFLEMAALLLASALLLPPVMVFLLGRAARVAPQPIPRWFWSDAAMGAPKLSLALMALLLALSANLGIKTMIGGFRGTFTQFLDERLAAEVYVRAPNAASASEMQAWLAAQPEVDAVLPNFSAQITVDRLPVLVASFVDHATYRETWSLLAATGDPWAAALEGSGLLVSEQMARSLGVWVGDALTLPTLQGDWTVPVVGVFADYGNPIGQIRLGLRVIESRFTINQRTDFGVRTAGDRAALMARIKERFDLDTDALIDQRDLKTLAVAIFDQTFVISEALSVLTLLVAAVALLSSLLMLFSTRLPQLAPLWGMGLRRSQLIRFEGARVLLLALLTAVLASPVGIGVAWILVTRINVLAFGWQLPMVIDPMASLTALLLAAMTAAVALVYPLVRLARVKPAVLAKIFAQEA